MKNILFHLACCGLLFVGFNNSIFAQTDGEPKPELGTIINGGNSMYDYTFVDENCVLHSNFSVFITQRGPGDYGDVMTIPSGLPPLGIQITSNGQTKNHLTDKFLFLDNVDTESDGIYSVFVYTFTYTIDISNLCPRFGDDPNIDQLAWEANLVALYPVESDPDLYPLCDHRGPSDIFFCEVIDLGFSDICGAEFCDEEEVNPYTGNFPVDCNGCNELKEEDEEGLPNEIRHADIQATEYTIAPNPFDDQLQIFWSKKEDVPQAIDLYDANGRLVKHWSSMRASSDALNLDTSLLPPGLYFIKINTTLISQSYRLIKR